MKNLEKNDPMAYDAVKQELKRIREGIELIPSENFVSVNVLEAMGTIFTNKYSEGYPQKRYYGGNQVVDIVEQTAIDRAKELSIAYLDMNLAPSNHYNFTDGNHLHKESSKNVSFEIGTWINKSSKALTHNTLYK